MTTVTAALIGVGLGLATHALYDAVKETFRKVREKRHPLPQNHVIELQEVPQEDGSRLLIVTIRQLP